VASSYNCSTTHRDPGLVLERSIFWGIYNPCENKTTSTYIKNYISNAEVKESSCSEAAERECNKRHDGYLNAYEDDNPTCRYKGQGIILMSG
jgi:hypothetical protein